MKKGFFLGCIILLSINLIYSQNKYLLDSLNSASLSKIDTIRFSALSDLVWELQQTNKSKATEYANRLLVEAKQAALPKWIAQGYNDKSIVYLNAGMLDLALKNADSSLTIRLKLGNKKDIASAYNKIGIISAYGLNYTNALNAQLKALSIYEELNIKPYIARTYSAISTIYRKLNKHPQSFQYLSKALEVYLQVRDTFNTVGVYSGMASSYDDLNKLDSAIYYNTMAKKLALKIGHISGAAVLANNLGVIYGKLHDVHKREECYLEAISLSKQIADTVNMAFYQNNLANTFLAQNKINEAEQLMRSSLAIALKSKNTENELDCYKALVGLYFYKQMPDSGIYYFERYRQIHDTVFSKQLAGNIAEMQTKYDVEKKDMQLQKDLTLIELNSQESRLKNLLLVFIITFAILIIVFFILRQQNQKKRYAAEIALKEQEKLNAILRTQENERSRMAQDLHDNMGAYATSIIAQIDNLELSESVKTERVKELRLDAENIMSTLRETIWILKTKEIKVSQFFDLLKTYAEKNLTNTSGIHVSYQESLNENITISPSVSLHLYRILQEIIQNILKHSRATNVQFSISSGPAISIKVTDNGIGFDINNLSRMSGLENMQYRAKEINYKLQITSVPAKGTEIVIQEV